MKSVLAALALATPAGAVVIHTHSGPSPANGSKLEKLSKADFGSRSCPCVGLVGLEGSTHVRLAENVTADYPADFAARCEAWDNRQNAMYCMPGQTPGADNGWCAEPWCYVDPCNCDLDEPPTKVPDDGYMPNASYQGKGLWYSYKTCGGTDSWMDAEKKKQHQESPKVCDKKLEEKKWGKEKCRCVGYDDVQGKVNVTIGSKELEYPGETGATCESWDAKRHPDCSGDKAADWCKQAWCYVDPCQCDLDLPPLTSSYLPSGLVNGKPVYFSYATCGGNDTFTATNKDACAHQRSQDNCTALDKCAWNGTDCLGKLIVQTCSYHSGAGSIKATFALALATFAAVAAMAAA